MKKADMKIPSVFRTASFLLLFSQIYAISNYEGCEISAGQTTLQWKWSNAHIGCWLSQSSPLTLTIKFLKYSHPQAHDIIEIGKSSTKIVHKRDNRKETTLKYNNEGTIEEGWAFFNLSVSHQYEVGYSSETTSYQSLFTFPLDLTVEKITVTGSNITINCNNNALVWRVGHNSNDAAAVVPFAGGLKQVNISLYSNLEMRPQITIDGQTDPIDFRWKSGTVTTTATDDPFPAFMEHYIDIICESKTDKQITCNINSNKSMIYSLKTQHRPRSLLVRGQEQLFFILHTNTPSDRKNTTVEPIIEPPEECSNVALLIAVIILIIILLIIIICTYWKHKDIKAFIIFTNGSKKENLVNEEVTPLMEDTNQSLQQQQQKSECLMQDDFVLESTPSANVRLWNAVSSGNEVAVENILKFHKPDPLFTLGDKRISAYQDAHQKGYKAIVELIDEHLKTFSITSENDIILDVMKAHESSVEEVFLAAKNGLFRNKNGVDVLLLSTTLPGTIMDKSGKSLLHYAASVKLEDGAPLWISEDIRSLVNKHGCYVDAVDYRGYSVLHALAESAVNSKEFTCWDKQRLTVTEAWLSLLKLFLDLGCNPTLSDHMNVRPEPIAREKGNIEIANEMHKACTDYSNNTESTFEDFLTACKSGNLSVKKKFLQNRVPILPLGSQGDPLLEVVKSSSRDDLFLLLSAGSPLCAHGLTGNTPLEAAYNIVGLPAIFPVVLIKAIADKLIVEENMIDESNEKSENLKKTIRSISNSLRNGNNVTEIFYSLLGQDSKYNRDLLQVASRLGLSLTCQLLGIAGVCLNSLPGESHPIKEALTTNHNDTAYTLCRDLKMSPYCAAGLSEERLQFLFKNDLFESDIEKFRRKEKNEKTLIKYLEQIKENKTNDSPDKHLLHLLAKNGLVSLLHKISIITAQDLNLVVHDVSGSTMLHIAAAYGETNMMEYFLTHGADPWYPNKGGLAAAHLAAIRGHKDCMEYILKYTKKDESCSKGMKASGFLLCYKDNLSKSYLDTMTSQDASMIKNITNEYDKAMNILEKYFKNLSIQTQNSLRDTSLKDQELMNDSKTKSVNEAITSDVKLLFKCVEELDQRFKGKVIHCGPIIEGYECFLPENYDFKLEIDGSNFSENVTVNMDDNGIVNVTSSTDTDLLKKTNFIDSFYNSVSKALKNTAFQNISLIPPFQIKLKFGTSVNALYRDQERALIIRIHLIPVIKVPMPPNHQLQLLGHKYEDLVRSIKHEHITNTNDGKWSYLFTNTELAVFTSLDYDKKLVFHTCFFLVKLMKECWWIQKKYQRQLGQALQTFPVGVRDISNGILKSLFFKELSHAQDTSWGEEHFIERLISIFNSAPVPGEEMENFILPKHWKFKVGDMPRAVVHILKRFQNKTTGDSN